MASSTHISEPEAWAIASRFADEAFDKLGDRAIAVAVVGSLAAGSYSPGRSDIDLIVVAHDDTPDEALQEISKMAGAYWKMTGIPKGFGGYALRQLDLQPPFGVLRETAFEILQLKRGRVIRGDYNLDSIPVPTYEHMRRSLIASVADILGAWSRPYPPPIDARDARVNAILYWLRFLIWDRTGNYPLGKRETIVASQGLNEIGAIQDLLSPIAAYVTQENASPPDDAAEICRQIENYILTLVDWVKEAADGVPAPETDPRQRFDAVSRSLPPIYFE